MFPHRASWCAVLTAGLLCLEACSGSKVGILGSDAGLDGAEGQPGDGATTTTAPTGDAGSGTADTGTASGASDTGTADSVADDSGSTTVDSSVIGPTADGGVEAGGDATQDGSTLGDSAAGDGSTIVTDGGLTIVSLSSSAASMTQGGFVTLSAVVLDSAPVTGLLTDPTGAVMYGTFASSAQGLYTVSLTWDAINAIAPLTFVGQSSLSVRASFSDTGGSRASASMTIALICGNGASPNGSCAGTCVDLSQAANCGSCGAACPAGALDAFGDTATCSGPDVCSFPTFVEIGEAGFFTTVTPTESCTVACAEASSGATCTSATATLVDDSTASATCSETGSTPSTSATTSFTATDIYCGCADGTFPDKDQTGSCATLCGAAGCVGVFAISATDGSTLEDACSAPYVYGDWDAIVGNVQQTDAGPFQTNTTVTLKDAPTSLACNCTVPPTP